MAGICNERTTMNTNQNRLLWFVCDTLPFTTPSSNLFGDTLLLTRQLGSADGLQDLLNRRFLSLRFCWGNQSSYSKPLRS